MYVNYKKIIVIFIKRYVKLLIKFLFKNRNDFRNNKTLYYVADFLSYFLLY